MSGIICRVCLSDDIELGDMISPCKCNGTIKYIHIDCFTKWVNISGNGITCPSCKDRYDDDFIVDIEDEDEEPKSCNICATSCVDEIYIIILQVILIICVSFLMTDGKVPVNVLAQVCLPIFLVLKIYNKYR